MGHREGNLEKQRMIADVYARTYAAAVATNDAGILPEAEAKKAVVGFVRMMKKIDHAEWGWYKEEEL